ncbi:MAG: phosphoadenylyl-sulfate reductase [Tannerella sp.]|jgi:phosphoadenosine phosphosulfate reductase|nr:phosphoadenylyl-sulfate reductase [Tannerella sp.]
MINDFDNMTPQEIIRYFLDKYGDRVALASSLGLEDQVLTDMMLKINPEARIFTIDTGRLFPETYSLIDRTNITYGIKMEVYFPEYGSIEGYVRSNGVNAFYESVEKRKECCRLRKILPLQRALSTLDVWICGLRREQSVTRTEIKVVEYPKDTSTSSSHANEADRLIKVNPLINFTEEDLWEYIRANKAPYNSLHEKGFPSIGCSPCTRAVASGEDIRAGRWWWENPEHKECGLHIN